jgi:branched-chain amino acid transport system ATP-binding protein
VRIYEVFPILKRRAKLYANLMSGGEQQMLAIARALMTNPDMLIMDEPSEGLAPLVVREISEIIGQLRGTHSVLLAEQNINMALGIADYVYIISKGSVVYESTPQELRSNMEIKSKFLGV